MFKNRGLKGRERLPENTSLQKRSRLIGCTQREETRRSHATTKSSGIFSRGSSAARKRAFNCQAVPLRSSREIGKIRPFISERRPCRRSTDGVQSGGGGAGGRSWWAEPRAVAALLWNLSWPAPAKPSFVSPTRNPIG